MNQKYKDDIIMILRDIGKDAGVIIAFSTVFIGSICFLNHYKEGIFVSVFISLLLSSWALLPLIVAFIVELLFSLIFFTSQHLSTSMKPKNVTLMALLVVVSAFLLHLIIYQIDSDSMITYIIPELIYMTLFLVPLYIHSSSKRILYLIVSLMLFCSLVSIVFLLPLIILWTTLFIILRYKNIPVNKTKLVLINILLIQSLDLSLISSLQDIGSEEKLIIGLIVVLYKIVVLYFRYKKYKDKLFFIRNFISKQ